MRYRYLAFVATAAAWAAGPEAVSAEGPQPAKASATAPAAALIPPASQPALATTQPAEAPARDKQIVGSWTWDIDTDKDGKEGTPDVWWSIDQGTRFLNPQNGASLVIIPDRAFDKIGRQDLEKLAYEKKLLSAVGPGAELKEGTVLGLRSSRGNFAKVQITGFEDVTGLGGKVFPRLNIKLRYVLYEVPGAADVPRQQPAVVVAPLKRPPIARRDRSGRQPQIQPAPPPLEPSGRLIP